MKILDSAQALVGKTPMLRLHAIEKEYNLEGKLIAKLECFNPAGSAKDRVALNMILDAEVRGILKPGATIIEPTSGNTGIGLASVATYRGYEAIIVMPDSMSMERRLLMSAFGAKLVLTPGAEGMTGAIAKAEELAKEIPGSFIPTSLITPPTGRPTIRPPVRRFGKTPMAPWTFLWRAWVPAAPLPARANT